MTTRDIAMRKLTMSTTKAEQGVDGAAAKGVRLIHRVTDVGRHLGPVETLQRMPIERMVPW